MQQGFKTKQNMEYFNISHGNICKNVAEGTDGSVRVEVKDKKTGEIKIYHEISHSSVTAIFENVTFKDDKFGKTWNLYLKINDKKICVQMKETSRICADFLKKLPNLKQGELYIFTPYDYIPNGKTKRSVGFSIKNSKEEKIQSYYHSYNEKTKESKELHGFPEYLKPKKDEEITTEDWKMFFSYTVMAKFLRPKSLEFIKNNFKNDFVSKAPIDDVDHDSTLPDFDESEDVPF